MIRTVRRRSREAQTFWDRMSKAVSYGLENYFIGEEVPVADVRDGYLKRASIGNTPRIWFDSKKGGVYVVHYHSNRWVELS